MKSIKSNITQIIMQTTSSRLALADPEFPRSVSTLKKGRGMPTYCLAISPKNCFPGAHPLELSLVWYKIKQLFKINPRFVYSCLPPSLTPGPAVCLTCLERRNSMMIVKHIIAASFYLKVKSLTTLDAQRSVHTELLRRRHHNIDSIY